MQTPIAETITFAGGSAGVAFIGGVGLWLANRVIGKAAFQTMITTGFAELHTQELAARIELRSELIAAREELLLARAELGAAKAQMASDRFECAKEVAGLRRVIGALRRVMRDAGLTVPADEELLQGPFDETA